MDTSLKIVISISLLLLLCLSAFFSAAETAYSSVSVAKLEAAARKKKKWALLIKKQHKSFGWTLSTILLANNLVNVGLSSLTTYFMSTLIHDGAIGALISTVVVTPILVIVGEITPKIFAKKYSLIYLKNVVYVLQFFNIIFTPLTFPLKKISLNSTITNSEKDIKNLLSIAQSEGVLEDEEATLAKRALELDELKVNEIITLRKDFVSVKASENLKVARNIFLESGHSRLVVTKNNKCIGILFLKDILFGNEDDPIKKFLIKPFYISKSIKVTKALEEMRKAGTHIALVTPSKNILNVIGLITLEDIIEELVGEIYDEHDPEEDIKEISTNKYIVKANTKLTDIEKELNIKFDSKADILTIKELLISKKRFKHNKKYIFKNIIFKVIKSKRKTLIEVLVK